MSVKAVPPARRRFFLTAALSGVGVALAAMAGWPLWRFLSPRTAPGGEEKILIPMSDIPPGGAHFFRFRGQPAVAVQPTPGSFVAFSAICTHLGCIVQWLPDQGEFLCPCHAGRFAPDGKVLSGPPPRPLEALPAIVSDDQLVVG